MNCSHNYSICKCWSERDRQWMCMCVYCTCVCMWVCPYVCVCVCVCVCCWTAVSWKEGQSRSELMAWVSGGETDCVLHAKWGIIIELLAPVVKSVTKILTHSSKEHRVIDSPLIFCPRTSLNLQATQLTLQPNSSDMESNDLIPSLSICMTLLFVLNPGSDDLQ